MLLVAAWKRLLVAGAAVALLWAAVIWAAPSLSPPAPVGVVARRTETRSSEVGPLRPVVRSGLAAPGGGSFDRFGVTGQPVVAPVNARGQVAFYATVVRAPARAGIFVAETGHISKIAALGDAAPGGGTLADFATDPLPALNAAGHVAFVARITGGRSTQGMFLAGDQGLQLIAAAGDAAPGVPAGVLAGFNAPALNDNDELAFVASVQRGRDLLDVLYFWNGRRLQRLVAEGELLLRIGGAMDQIGEPALNNSGVVAFPAAILKGPVLGGIFVAGARDLRLLVGAGAKTPGGTMILRFSERVSVDDDDAITFGAYLGDGGQAAREAILRFGSEGLSEIAIEGAEAPGGGRYAGFGPWPAAGPDGLVGFIAALDGGPGPLAAFAGAPGAIRRIATVGEALPQGLHIGRFALNAVAAVGQGGTLTFVTSAQADGERDAIYCRCP